jgi:hypothetical protein
MPPGQVGDVSITRDRHANVVYLMATNSTPARAAALTLSWTDIEKNHASASNDNLFQ